MENIYISKEQSKAIFRWALFTFWLLPLPTGLVWLAGWWWWTIEKNMIFFMPFIGLGFALWLGLVMWHGMSFGLIKEKKQGHGLVLGLFLFFAFVLMALAAYADRHIGNTFIIIVGGVGPALLLGLCLWLIQKEGLLMGIGQGLAMGIGQVLAIGFIVGLMSLCGFGVYYMILVGLGASEDMSELGATGFAGGLLLVGSLLILPKVENLLKQSPMQRTS